jgi:hypothetical protein
MQSIAMLDAILSPEWQYRYFSFNSCWASGQQMGSMRNGSGDHFYALFNSAGCWLKGFDHELGILPSGIFDGVPEEFAKCLTEPAFTVSETTFCIWRLHTDHHWQRSPLKVPTTPDDPDGSAQLLWCLDGRPQTYHRWAEDYYDRDVSLRAVAAIYDHRPIDEDIVRELNADAPFNKVSIDVVEIGYVAK